MVERERPGAGGTVRRRPKDRPDRILTAAAQLFRERGYHGAGIDEIGEAAGISGPAVYRHFSNKQAILLALAERALQSISASIEDAIAAGADPEARLEGLVRASARETLNDSDLAAIFFRELRHVPMPEHLVRIQRSHARRNLDTLRSTRPELDEDRAIFMMRSLVGLFSSVLYYESGLSRKRLEELLTRMAVRALSAPLPAVEPAGGTTTGDEPIARRSSRREVILATAIEMFHRHGYKGVGIDDIGVASDISGPAVYRYFRNKDDLLAAAFNRANEQLAGSVSTALSGLLTTSEALDKLVGSYAEIVVHNSDLIALYLTQGNALSPENQTAAQRGHRIFVDEWVNVLRQLRPELPGAEARAIVQGAIGLINGYRLVTEGDGKTSVPFREAQKLLVEMAKRVLLEA